MIEMWVAKNSFSDYCFFSTCFHFCSLINFRKLQCFTTSNQRIAKLISFRLSCQKMGANNFGPLIICFENKISTLNWSQKSVPSSTSDLSPGTMKNSILHWKVHIGNLTCKFITPRFWTTLPLMLVVGYTGLFFQTHLATFFFGAKYLNWWENSIRLGFRSDFSESQAKNQDGRRFLAVN